MSLLSTHISSITLPKNLTRHRHHDNDKNHRNDHHLYFSLHCNRHRLSLSSSSRIFSSSQPSALFDDDEEPDRETKPISEPASGSPETQVSATEPEETGGEVEKNWELKRCLVDTVYGSGFGIGASSEIRAEVTELINQLEAVNPVSSPTEFPELLDGNWILVYTASSELLPLLAVGTTPLLKVERISQNIDTKRSIVENATTLSTPFATFSFSATAGFDVRSPSRIQVQFKEASFKPPQIKSRFDLPESVDIFGQRIPLSPVQQLLNPVQEAAASISGSLYGLPPLNVPIPGERTSSWLITTYLDDDFRISRGDGGLFVLVREGSSLLDQ